MPEKAWTEPSPSDWDRWELRLLAGEEPSTAAKAEGQTCSNFRRNDPDRHEACLEMGREARAHYADERAEVWSQDPEADDRMRERWLKRWNPAYDARARVTVDGELEVTTPDVSLAIDRFTDALARAVARNGTEPAALEPGRGDESTARLRVAPVDRTA